MIKIFGYELKRLILNKFFLGLLVITAFYSRMILTSDIILGIAYTAPFSAWSYGTYIGKLLPLLLITLLFFISFLYSKQEKSVQSLTFATKINLFQYGLIKCAAMLTGFALITLMSIGISFHFYSTLFQYSEFTVFLIPILVTILPAMLFTLGIGMFVGRLHPVLIYCGMLLLLLLGQFELPNAIDLLGVSYYSTYPFRLPVSASGEAEFLLTSSFLLSRAIFAGIGILLASIGIKQFKAN